MTQIRLAHPPNRRLRIFAFDPSVSRHVDTAAINIVTVKLPWDENVTIGPVDEYLEVVDYDPASQVFYPPIDLNNPYLLAQDGLTRLGRRNAHLEVKVESPKEGGIDLIDDVAGP